jgi:hypothetical protein
LQIEYQKSLTTLRLLRIYTSTDTMTQKKLTKNTVFNWFARYETSQNKMTLRSNPTLYKGQYANAAYQNKN